MLTLFPYITIILAFLLGLIIGSFLNVVAIRMLRKESIAYPPSHCMSCGHELRPRDLIPVFSFLFAKGRCRYCQADISRSYPLGELAAGFVFALIVWQMGLQWETLVGLVFASLLIVAVQTDLREMVIPNKLVLAGIIGIALLRIWIHPLPYLHYVAGFIIGGGILYLIAFIGMMVLKKMAMGGGDVKLFAMLGLVLGGPLVVLNVFVSSVLGVLYAGLLMLRGRYRRGEAFPFAPFIATGALICYLWGQRWLDWYMALL